MPVKVILKEDIDSLGKAGELVNVKPGYARNFLLPQGLGVIATLQNLIWLKEHRAKLQEEAQQKKEASLAQKTSIEALGDISILAQVGPTGKLFGRVTTKVLAEKISELSEAALVFNHKAISINGYPHGIDELGTYGVVISLNNGIKANLNLIVSEG